MFQAIGADGRPDRGQVPFVILFGRNSLHARMVAVVLSHGIYDPFSHYHQSVKNGGWTVAIVRTPSTRLNHGKTPSNRAQAFFDRVERSPLFREVISICRTYLSA